VDPKSREPAAADRSQLRRRRPVTARDTHLGGQHAEEVVIRREGPDGAALTDGRGQRLDLIEAAVQLVQSAQPGGHTRTLHPAETSARTRQDT